MARPSACIVIGVDGGTPTVIEQYVREGALPNLAAMMKEGAYAEACLPAMPTITPTCWATIATGATPAVHGCTCATLHKYGRPLLQTENAYWSERVQAEFIWEAAERAGRTAMVVAYPTSWPPRLKRGIQIGGPGCGVVEYHTADSSLGNFIVDGLELQFFTTDSIKDDSATQITLTPGPNGASEAVLQARARHSAWPVEPVGWRARFLSECRVAFSDLYTNEPFAVLEVGQWSGCLRKTILGGGIPRHVTYRMKLIAASQSNRRLTVYVTPMADISGRVSPTELGTAINAIEGVPMYWHHGALMQRGTISLDTFLEIEQQNDDWRKRTLQYLIEHRHPELIFLYSVMMDTINHKFRCLIEGYPPVDEAARSEAIAFERAAYGIVDEFVGSMREMLGREAAIFVVSDHGSCGYSRYFSIRETLKKAGLLVTRKTATGEEIDWSASRAVPMHSSYVCVNLAGREPTGIVPPAEYERTVDQIIAALYDAADPDTGKRMVALALRREDARLVGLGGENMADVVFAVAGGIGSPGGGVHAGQIPTARSRSGIQCALLLACGPGIRKGVRITRTVRQHDIAPTISALMGIPAPRHAEGAPIREMLEEAN